MSAYENGRFAESTRYVRSYPEQLPVLRDLLPAISVPVQVFAAAYDPLVPVSNGRYLAERIPGSELTILAATHFAWEEIPDQFATLVADWVAPPRRGPPGPASKGAPCAREAEAPVLAVSAATALLAAGFASAAADHPASGTREMLASTAPVAGHAPRSASWHPPATYRSACSPAATWLGWRRWPGPCPTRRSRDTRTT